MGKLAHQSSTKDNDETLSGPQLAVDGFREKPVLMPSTCSRTHMNQEGDPAKLHWLAIDLGRVYNIHGVHVTPGYLESMQGELIIIIIMCL